MVSVRGCQFECVCDSGRQPRYARALPLRPVVQTLDFNLTTCTAQSWVMALCHVLGVASSCLHRDSIPTLCASAARKCVGHRPARPPHTTHTHFFPCVAEWCVGRPATVTAHPPGCPPPQKTEAADARRRGGVERS